MLKNGLNIKRLKQKKTKENKIGVLCECILYLELYKFKLHLFSAIFVQAWAISIITTH